MNMKISIALLTSIVLFVGCSEKKEHKEEKKIEKVVKILDLKDSQHFRKTFEYPALVKAFQDTTMAFEVSGKIVKFYYKEGEKVKKGSVIAKLDDEIYRANYDSAKANYTQAQLDYKRYKKLYTLKAIPKMEYEKQKQNLDVTKAALQVAKKNLDETKLIAEFDGILAKKIVNDYARVNAKQAIVRLQDNSSYKIKFFVPENDILQVKEELNPKNISNFVSFYVSLGNDKSKKIEAKLIDISTTAEEVTRTFETTLQIQKQKDITILPGMTAQVNVIENTKYNKRVFIPYKAVFTDETKNTFIWAVDKNNRVSKQKIRIGELVNDSVEVLKGIENISKIVISGVRFLEPKDIVKEYEKIGD